MKANNALKFDKLLDPGYNSLHSSGSFVMAQGHLLYKSFSMNLARIDRLIIHTYVQ